jgi:hypothetical protein
MATGTDEAKTGADGILSRLKQHRYLAPVFVVSAVIIGVGSFTDAISKLSGFAVKIYDPELARARHVARTLHNELAEFMKKHHDNPTFVMPYTAFRIQDERYPARFNAAWTKTGIPNAEMRAVERIYELKHYLTINYHIPFSDPKSLLPNLWFVVDGLSSQRQRPLNDYQIRNIRSGEQTGYDRLSYGLYTSALAANPTALAGDYLKKMVEDLRNNYVKQIDLITFINTLAWDIAYLPIDQFFLQDQTIATEFLTIERKIHTLVPDGQKGGGGYTARERIDAYLTFLEIRSNR